MLVKVIFRGEYLGWDMSGIQVYMSSVYGGIYGVNKGNTKEYECKGWG